MPKSPVKRAGDEPESDKGGDGGGSMAGSGKAKRKPKPTKPATHYKKKVKARYQKAREDAQLVGVIPTTPDGAVRPEVVPSCAQGEQPLPNLVGVAIRRGWAVPEERKPGLVDELVAIVDNPEMPAKVKVAAFNALRQADQAQFERDHPELMAKLRGGSGAQGAPVHVSVNVQANLTAVELLNRMIDDPDGSLEENPTPDIAGTSGDGGHEREVESGPASQANQ